VDHRPSGSGDGWQAFLEAAVTEAGSLDQHAVIAALDQHAVIAALDHATLAEGPGGPAEMVPGEHHVRLNMYIARAQNGTFRIIKDLGAIDPKEPRDATGLASEPLAAGGTR
jgi:hypothetical protein